MTDPMTDPRYRDLMRVSANALKGRINEDPEKVADALVAIACMHSSTFPAVVYAGMVWTDLLRIHILGDSTGAVRSKAPTMIFTTDGGQYVVGSAQADTEICGHALWAIAVIEAALARDDQRWDRLWRHEIPRGELSRYTFTLLESCALTIRELPPGLTRQEPHP